MDTTDSDVPWTVVHRAERTFPALPAPATLTIQAPPEQADPEPAGGWTALLPLLGSLSALGFAVVTRNPIYLAVGVLVVTASLVATYAGRRVGTTRDRRRRDRRSEAYVRHIDDLCARASAAAQAQRDGLDGTYPDPTRLLTAARDDGALWERRRQHVDFGTVRIGLGPVRALVRLTTADGSSVAAAPADEHLAELAAGAARTTSTLATAPVTLDLTHLPSVAIVGPPAATRSMARAWIGQLCTFHSPADLRLVGCAAADVLEHWDWLKWLPHTVDHRAADVELARTIRTFSSSPDELAAQLEPLVRRERERGRSRSDDEAAASAPPSVVVVVDGYRPATPVARTPWLDHVLAHGRDHGLTVILLCATVEDLPADCAAQVELQPDGTCTYRLSGAATSPTSGVLPDDLAVDAATELARWLAGRRPDDQGQQGEQGPARLSELLAATEVDASSSSSGRLRGVPIGQDDRGRPVLLSLDEAASGGDGPHGVLVGATGSGKSELLKSFVAGLAASHPPGLLDLLLVDYKGGAAFAGLARAAAHGRARDQPGRRPEPDHPGDGGSRGRDRTEATPPSYDRARVGGGSAGRGAGARPAWAAVVPRRGGRRVRRAAVRGACAARHLRAHRPARPFPRGPPAAGQPTTGRGAPRRPRVAPALPDRAADVHCRGVRCRHRFDGRLRAAALARPGSSQGRRRGHGVSSGAGHVAAPSSRGRGPTGRRRAVRDHRGATPGPTAGRLHRCQDQLDALVDTLRTRFENRARPVWTPPLPETAELRALPVSTAELGAVVGLVDEPELQRQVPLHVDLLRDGGVIVVGAGRSGRSTFLRTLVRALTARHDPGELQVYGLDLGGNGLSALGQLPHVAAVVDRHDADGVVRVLDRVHAVAKERAQLLRTQETPHPTRARILLLVDHLLQLRADHPDEELRLSELATTGPALGIHLAVTAGRWLDVRPALLDGLGLRLELRLADAVDSHSTRAVAESVPRRPGRGLTAEGRAFQLATADDAHPVRLSRAGHVAPALVALPRQVTEPADGEEQTNGFPLGVAEGDGGCVSLDLLARGMHLLVFGDAGSGRSTLLARATDWLATRHAQDVNLHLIDPARTLLDAASSPAVAAYAYEPVGMARLVHDLAATLADRYAPAGLSHRELAARSWWSGVEHVLVVDDYDLLVRPEGSPVIELVDALAAAGDLGWHVVIARRVTGAARVAYDPFGQRLREQAPMGVLLSGDPGEGRLLGGVAATQSPPGRARLVRPGEAPLTVQTYLPSLDR